ncbi:endonuclease/exonuclease/phosphatase family protein [Wenxinia saemankumensis]|uniref:Uncharacterized conserved protein YafD, endonuclease/exonuclease/phosphatase (EEP) superfamily n=1 Tax=Wenxinia saemankumensis TaxID=1447782 RepID=A0A1M6AKK6_9RHOB|nr:endonuclease/exonuclease/phosphatase family protein [Wenxinia saemankumensis]SHI36996.1 Uncharacterized conserved protein YafD, endonuclease/exonuclease/phosphatase (EEP) superfamily [Wenxinia saemankumensis]
MKTALRWIVGLALAGLSIASLVPLLETNAWWARMLDFPRMQVLGLLVALGIVFAALGGFRRAGFGLFLLVLAAVIYQGRVLSPYTPLAAKMDPGGAACGPDARLSVLVANVQKSNRHAEAVLQMAAAQDSDVLVLLETSEWWNGALAPLDDRYAHHVQAMPEQAEYFGMHVFSRFELSEAEMRIPFNTDTPLFAGTLRHPAGDIRLFGIHPRPPQSFDQGTTMRDATLLEAAIEAADDPRPAILAGDWNATPWERTAQRAMRLGRLADPRVGRGPLLSFDANSWWIKWPLDQILWQEGLSLATFQVLPGIGADHYPVRADLCVGGGTGLRLVPPREDDIEEARTSIAAARPMPDDAVRGPMADE